MIMDFFGGALMDRRSNQFLLRLLLLQTLVHIFKNKEMIDKLLATIFVSPVFN